MSKQLRLFLALEIEEAARRRILPVQQDLQARMPDLRWVRPSHYHLTLRFLGDTPPAEMPSIHQAMDAAAAETPPLTLQLRGLGQFSGGAVWVGVEPHPDLGALARRLGARALRPHITLARARQKLAEDLDKQFSLGSSQAHEIVLFSSRPGAEGSLYSVEYRAPLRGRL